MTNNLLLFQEMAREVRLMLDASLKQKRMAVAGTANAKSLVGYSINQAIGHFKSLAEQGNPSRSLVLSVKCRLAPEQYQFDIIDK